MSGVDKYPDCHKFLSLSFCCFGFFVTHTGLTVRPILTTSTSYDAFQHKDVSLAGFVDMPIHLVGQISQKPSKGARTCIFKLNAQNTRPKTGILSKLLH